MRLWKPIRSGLESKEEDLDENASPDSRDVVLELVLGVL